MTGTMRVVLIGHDHPSSPSLIAGLEDYGCSIVPMTTDDANAEAIQAQGANAIVIRAGDSPLAATETARLLKAGKPATHLPIIIIGNVAKDKLDDDAIDGVVDDQLPAESMKSELMSRLRSLTRLHVMQSELSRREAVEQRYGLTPDTPWNAPIDEGNMHVLAVGDFNQDRQLLVDMLGNRKSVAFSPDPNKAIEELVDGHYEAAIIAVNGAADQWLTLCADIRDNPRLYNLPVLLVADKDSFIDPTAPFDHGASDLLLRPIDADNLRARLALLIKQQRYRGRMLEAYRRSLHIETSDSLTGLYSYGFLHDYLADLIDDVGRSGSQVAVGIFDVKDMAGINARYGYAAGDILLRQTGGLIGRLVRGEDLTARYGGQSFCVVMPETAYVDAIRVMRRIVNIVSMTELGVSTDRDPVAVRLKLGCVILEAGDSAESLLGRALTKVA
jgi:two-component system cell cycle response regulator